MAVSLATLALFAMLVVITSVVGLVSGSSPPQPTTRPTYSPTPRPTPQPAVWKVQTAQLRTDLAAPELISSMDGTFDDVRVIDAGRAWLVLSGDKNDSVSIHALDPTTGAPLWQRSLPSGLCARNLVDQAVLCASATATDPTTGLGTKWHLALLDPATGNERRGAEFEGWLTLIYATKTRVLLLEQRQPAPRAVLTGLNAELATQWKIDLRDQPQHAGMFSDNRIIYRKLPIPPGPALDRPRIRTVANGLTALWVGQTTAFVDLAKGKLIGMPRCSRLVDDGQRLWCNQGDLAAALSYSLTPLHETDLGTRLAFPYRDPREGDRTDPVFLTSDGKAVRVNLTTGRTTGPLVNTRNGSAFGIVTSPQVADVRGLTLLWDSTNVFAVKVRTGELVWQMNNNRSFSGAVVLDWNGRILLAGTKLTLLDRNSGATLFVAAQPYGLYTNVVGKVLVGIGPDEIARLVDP